MVFFLGRVVYAVVETTRLAVGHTHEAIDSVFKVHQEDEKTGGGGEGGGRLSITQ